MVSLASPRKGSTTCGTKSFLSFAGSKLSLLHVNASTPAVIEPPDTLEIRLRRPSSLGFVEAPQDADVEHHGAVAAAGQAQAYRSVLS